MTSKAQSEFSWSSRILIGFGLPALSALFLYLEHLTHQEFLLHLAAIPMEILLGAIVVERYMARQEQDRKRRQLMYIKSYLFRSRMRNLFLSNFEALKKPKITMAMIRNSSPEELRKLREAAGRMEYRSTEALEPVIMEYVNAHAVFRDFMDWAITNHFEDIFQNMIRLLHFIQDVELFKKHNPDRAFIDEAAGNPELMAKVEQVLRDGIFSFLDYVIEIREGQPEVFEELINDYEFSSQMKR
jgi:hypothetical protein